MVKPCAYLTMDLSGRSSPGAGVPGSLLPTRWWQPNMGSNVMITTKKEKRSRLILDIRIDFRSISTKIAEKKSAVR